MDQQPGITTAAGTAHQWSRRKVLGLTAAAGAALVAPLPALRAGARTAPGAGDNAAVAWDLNAQSAIWDVAGQTPAEQARSFAIVNGAVYDAVNAVAGTPYEPYLLQPSGRRHGSPEAATATAAHQVLVWMFPDQQDRLQGLYDEYLAGIPDGPSKEDGIAVGGDAAAAMIEARQDDGAFGDQVWPEATAPGEWRPVPPELASAGAWTAFLEPFLIPDVTQFPTPGPPDLTSDTYARDVDEAASLGSATSTTRTPDQTEAAIYWADNRLVHWEIKRQLAVTQGLSLLETARLFVLADMTLADATIACFAEKYRWGFWRPITAIHEAGADGNPGTEPDPTWTQLIATPPFPEYPSGHTSATSARMSTFRTYFGRDRVPFSAYSADADATRHFTTFSQARDEVVGARVWGGMHFRTADVDGVPQGEAITAYAFGHYFRRR